MREKSPFALATASVPIASTGSFAANWYLGAIGRLGDTDFVTIKSRDLSVQFTLFGHEPNPEHRVSISSVNWSDTVGESSVILQKGTETAKLEFNQSLLRAPAPAAAKPPSPAVRTSAVPPDSGPTLAAQGNTPVIVPNQADRPFPTAARNPTTIQRRVQIIAQPR